MPALAAAIGGRGGGSAGLGRYGVHTFRLRKAADAACAERTEFGHLGQAPSLDQPRIGPGRQQVLRWPGGGLQRDDEGAIGELPSLFNAIRDDMAGCAVPAHGPGRMVEGGWTRLKAEDSHRVRIHGAVR